MGLFDFFKKAILNPTKTKAALSSSKISVSGDGVSQSSQRLALSQHSGLPRYYAINGIKYDIDNPEHLSQFPFLDIVIEINGVPYGMDTILFEQYRKTQDKDIADAAYHRCRELRDMGIVQKSQWELTVDKYNSEKRVAQEKRKRQCDSFTIEDMDNFPDIPFGFHWVMQLMHTNGVAWFMLNMNNQEIALHYISIVNQLIIDAHEYIDGISDNFIDISQINWDYPEPMKLDSMACTRVECYPYTNTGKLSKYPAVLVFSTHPQKRGNDPLSEPVVNGGEIKIMRDGNIGSALVSIWGNTYRIGLRGLSLIIKRVDNIAGNLFKFNDLYE